MARRNQQNTENPSRDNEPWLAIQPAADNSGFYYAGVGARLRRERELLEETLEETCQRLRIRQAHLRAIEEGRFDELPGRIYAIGFVRTYAEYLGLDGPTIIERFKQETAGEEVAPKLVFPTPTPESRLPKGWLILLSIALATTAYGGWYYWQDLQHEEIIRVVEVPPDLVIPVRPLVPAVAQPPRPAPTVDGGVGRTANATPILDWASPLERPVRPDAELTPAEPVLRSGAPIEQNSASEDAAALAVLPPSPAEPVPLLVVPPSADPPASPAAASAPAFAPAPPSLTPAEPALPPPSAVVAAPPAVVAATPPVAPAAGSVAAPDRDPSATQSWLPPPAPPSAAAANDAGSAPRAFGGVSARIVIAALMDSWVQVRSTAGELLLTQILHAGDIYNVPDRADIVLMTGNAGGLKIVVDGEMVPPIGEVGEIRRDVVLTVAALRQR